MSDPRPTIFTIGYAGASIDGVLAALRAAGVEALADVRAVAASRNRPFSKTALSEALAGAGIAYHHFRGLGTPKAGREAARHGDRDTFTRIYAEQMETPEAQDALARLRALAAAQPTCLMCMESDPDVCHRSMVADRLSGFEVRHLFPQER